MVCLGSTVFACAIFDPGDLSGYPTSFLSAGQNGRDLTCGLAGIKKTAINFCQNGRAPKHDF